MTFFPQSNPLTQPGDLRVAESRNQIDLLGVFGTSLLRNIVEENGSATVANVTGEHRLRNTASGSDSCAISSTERVRFHAGSQGTVSITGRRPVAPVGNQSFRAGMFDANNGFGIGEDATGAFIFNRAGGAESKVYSTSWNRDKMDGTGTSGLVADFSLGAFMGINFDCYCYGDVNYTLTVYNPNTGHNETVLVHTLRNLSVVQTQDPNVPIRVEADNAGTATTFDVFFGARSFRAWTPNEANLRYGSDFRLAQTPGTTFIPAVSLRRKTAFANRKVFVDGYDIISDTDLIAQVRINGSLTGASWATPSDYTASETAMEADKSATAISGGEVIWQGFISGGAKTKERGSTTSKLVNLDIPSTQNVTLCVRTTTGTATRVDSILRVSEEW